MDVHNKLFMISAVSYHINCNFFIKTVSQEQDKIYKDLNFLAFESYLNEALWKIIVYFSLKGLIDFYI